VTRRNRRQAERSPAYVVENGRRTHVLVPLQEYDRLLDAAELNELTAKLEDRSAEWIDADEVALKLAGSRLAEARKARGWTQKRLGEKLGLPQSQISRIERNPDHTTVRTLKRIARALGVKVSALLR
jgi:ribosome-binding protein aMBF1 (putative translation factor)